MASLAMSIAKSEFIVGGKYRLMRKIGSGSFGDIYLGINISNGEVSQPQASFSANLHDLLLDCCLPASQFCFLCSVRVSHFPFLGPNSSRLAKPDRESFHHSCRLSSDVA